MQLKRRDFLRCAMAGIGALALGGPLAGSAGAARKPNVIIIYTDDQGSCDMPSYGATDLVLPNMERLAARGVRFTQMYAPAPVCSPSRAGLLTGRYPIRAGVPGNVSSMEGHAGMPNEQITIAEMMKAAGYATAHIGKWHLGYSDDTEPNAQGFDYSFGHMGGCIDNYSHFFYWNGPNRHDLWRNGERVHRPGEFFPDLTVEEAGKFIEDHAEQPFFMYFAMNTPHYPYQGEPEWLADYQRRGMPYPRDEYAAFMSTLDERIGALIDKVEEQGLTEDTIIIFQSDHGHSTEERAHFGGGSAGIYRGAKFSLFEGGIRVPSVVSWPGHLPAGAVRDQMVHGCDWMPTIAALCGVPLADEDIDGKNISEVIESPEAASPHEVLHWTHGGGDNYSWALRQGDWKLLRNPRDTSEKAPITGEDKLFLVNVAKDPTEMTNVAGEHPEVVKRMKALHEEWYGAVSQ
jgi:arylsulfatase A